MTTLTRSLATVLLLLMLGAAVEAQQPPTQQPPPQQTEYVPIDQLPPSEQLAAAPLLIGAYSFVFVVLFLYIVSLSRRLTSVQREVERLDTSLKQGRKA
jgi:CcmD family protein